MRGARSAGIWRGRGWLWRAFLMVFTVLVLLPIVLLLVFRFLPIPGTPNMLIGLAAGKGVHYRWSDDHFAPPGTGGDRRGRSEFLPP